MEFDKTNELMVGGPDHGYVQMSYGNAVVPTMKQNQESPPSSPGPSNTQDDKRKRRPEFLNTVPKFYLLNNDTLMAEVWGALQKAQQSWLNARDVLALLEFGKIMDLGARAPFRPPSGTVFYFDSRAGEYFRRDGYDYVKKKGSGISVREDHVKLRQGSVSIIYASYVHSSEWLDPVTQASIFHRRSYWLVDSDEKNRGVIVHYLGNTDAKIEPNIRAHDTDCECVMCCLKRENSRPDRPGESLEQIFSRVQTNIKPKKKKKRIPQPSVGVPANVTPERKRRKSKGEDTESDTGEDGSAIEEQLLAEDRRRERESRRRAAAPTQSMALPSSDSEDGDYHASHAYHQSVPRHQVTPGSASKDYMQQSAWGHSSHNDPTAHHSFNLEEADLYPIPSLLTPLQSRRCSKIDFDTFSVPDFDTHEELLAALAQPTPNNYRGEEPQSSRNMVTSIGPSTSLETPQFAQSGTFNNVKTDTADAHSHLHVQALGSFNHASDDPGLKKSKKDIKTPKPSKDPSIQKPATRFDFRNLAICDVCPGQLKENAKTLVVIGMSTLPETLNWRTWCEKIIPKISVWFGEYRLPNFDSVALGVIRFNCPPRFRDSNVSSTSESQPFTILYDDKHVIPLQLESPLVWDNDGDFIKRARPSLTPIKDSVHDIPSMRALDRQTSLASSAIDEQGEDDSMYFEEEDVEAEHLDRTATDMVERVVRLMTSSGSAQVKDIINEVDHDNGFNFLHTAVYCGASPEVVQMLLEHGADPNTKTTTPDGNAALHLACDQGNVAIARVLIKGGANTQLLNDQGFTPEEMILHREQNESDDELFALLKDGATDFKPSSSSSSSMMHSPRRVPPSPRPGSSPPRPPSNSFSGSGDGFNLSQASHMSLLREALSGLSLKEQYTLTMAVNKGDSAERNRRRTASLPSLPAMVSSPTKLWSTDAVSPLRSSTTAILASTAAAEPNQTADSHDHDDDDVGRVVAENETNVLLEMSKVNDEDRLVLDAEARKIQSNVRAWILRRQYQKAQEAATKVQALAKGHLARRHFRELREKASATLVIQKSLRAHINAKRIAKLQQQQQTSPQLKQQPEKSAGSHNMEHQLPPMSSVSGLGLVSHNTELTPMQSRSGNNDPFRRESILVSGDTNSASAADLFLNTEYPLFEVNMKEE